jgi:hypothetical protein
MFSSDRKPRSNEAPGKGQTIASASAPIPPSAQPPIPPSVWITQNLGFSPDATQSLILDHPGRRTMLCCCRQWGKSTLAAAKAVHTAVTQPGALIIIGAPTERQSGELVNKARAFAQSLGQKCKSDRAVRQSVVLENGSRILGLPENPATVRGYSNVALLIIDEAAFVSDAYIQSLRGFLSRSNGALWYLSTAGSRQGYFYEHFHNSDLDYARFKVSAEDCPRISKEFLAEERKAISEADYRRDYLCEFSDGEECFFTRELIDQAFTDPAPYEFPNKFSPHFFLGLDLGQSQDHTALAVIRLHYVEGPFDPVYYANPRYPRLELCELIRVPLQTPYTEIPRIVGNALSRCQANAQGVRHTKDLVIDAAGPGAPVVDLIRAAKLGANLFPLVLTAGHNATTKPGGLNTLPRKDALTRLRILLETKQLTFSNQLTNMEQLKRELYHVHPEGRDQHEHDDLAIAVSLAAWRATIAMSEFLRHYKPDAA